MAGTRPVLVTTSIIVHVPEDDEEGFTFVEPFSEKLREAVEKTFANVPEVEYPGVFQYDPIWIDEANIGHCAKCGQWVTDYTKPDDLPGIAGGRVVDGQFLCDECEVFGSDPNSFKYF